MRRAGPASGTDSAALAVAARRPMIALLAALAALAILSVGLAGCGTRANAPSDSARDEAASAESTEAAAALSAEALHDYLETASMADTWFAALEQVERRVKLGSPVFELRFRGTAEEVMPLTGRAFELLRASDLEIQAWVEAWAQDRVVAGAGYGTPIERELPPPPEDVGALRAWLAAVYGPDAELGGEAWYASIESIELGESAAMTPVITVTTSLPATGRRAADHARLALTAVAQSQPTFASEIEIWYADEAGLLSGSTETYDPYVY